MEQKSIRDIINDCDDLHLITVSKTDKHDRNTWSFSVNDKTSSLNGTNDLFRNYNYNIVTIKKKDHYFLGYKILCNGSYEYFVDPKKSNHRNSSKKYVGSLLKYSVYSNDISKMKNVPSFRVTEDEMKENKIDNYLDLCHYYGEYSAIGTGMTRNIRNIILMDIDVDCEEGENALELNNLLIKFGEHNALPDFVVCNHESKHVQLQWLIKSIEYKIINKNVVNDTVRLLDSDKIKDGEINMFGTDFLELSPIGIVYRRYTRALTDIVNKHKFGDKQFTFWKAKNFYTALLGKQNLELRMPYLWKGTIKYLSKEQMINLFDTKQARQAYYEEAPTIVELLSRTDPFVHDSFEKITEKKVSNIKDGDLNESVNSKNDTESSSDSEYGLSRNTFVLNCSRNTTWEIARSMHYKSYNDIIGLDKFDYDAFRNKVYSTTWKRYKKEDKKYKGFWPETSNHTIYKKDEFDNTFEESFNYAIQNIKSYEYSDIQRNASSISRHLKKDMHLTIVDFLRKSTKMNRSELLEKANKILESSGQKMISIATLKRCICISKDMTERDRKKLYNNFIENVDMRRENLRIAIEKKNEKAIETYSKRLNYLSINIIEDIREYIKK